MKIKLVSLICLSLTIGISSFAQKKGSDEVPKDSLYAIAQRHDMVIEANIIFDKTGAAHSVPSNNFVMVDGDKFILQTTSVEDLKYDNGPKKSQGNGLGGITLVGDITDYQLKELNPKRAISLKIEMNVPGQGHGTVFLTISGARSARAVYTDNIGNRLTFSGPVMPKRRATVYMGTQN